MKCLLFPISNQSLVDIKSNTLIDAMRMAFHLDVPTHEKIVLKLQRTATKDNNAFQAVSKELETRLLMLDRHPYYSENAFDVCRNFSKFSQFRK